MRPWRRGAAAGKAMRRTKRSDVGAGDCCLARSRTLRHRYFLDSLTQAGFLRVVQLFCPVRKKNKAADLAAQALSELTMHIVSGDLKSASTHTQDPYRKFLLDPRGCLRWINTPIWRIARQYFDDVLEMGGDAAVAAALLAFIYGEGAARQHYHDAE